MTQSGQSSVDPRFWRPETIFFGIGAQKAGTSWLASYLRSHPEVCSPIWKEQNYWNVVDGAGSPGTVLEARAAKRKKLGPILSWLRDVGTTDTARRNRGAGRAIRASRNAGPPHREYADSLFLDVNWQHCRSAGEISPSYAFLSSRTFAEMASISEKSRFIFLLRDPVDRFFSGLRHEIARSGVATDARQKVFDDQIAADLEAGTKSVAARLSRYDMTMAELEAVVSVDQIHYAFFEDLFDQREVDRICDFLEVRRHPSQPQEKVNGGTIEGFMVSEDQRRRVAHLLAPCYRMIRERFADKVPQKWSVSERLSQEAAANA